MINKKANPTPIPIKAKPIPPVANPTVEAPASAPISKYDPIKDMPYIPAPPKIAKPPPPKLNTVGTNDIFVANSYEFNASLISDSFISSINFKCFSSFSNEESSSVFILLQ